MILGTFQITGHQDARLGIRRKTNCSELQPMLFEGCSRYEDLLVLPYIQSANQQR